ncbi:MAG: hypothetical protein RLZZ351_601, partial [Pseudomonadota bacterium]
SFKSATDVSVDDAKNHLCYLLASVQIMAKTCTIYSTPLNQINIENDVRKKH